MTQYAPGPCGGGRPDTADKIQAVIAGLACIVLFACAVMAQEVRVVNFGQATFDGWVRATVDFPIPAAGKLRGGVEFVAGRRFGTDMRCVDLRMRIPPGKATVDFSEVKPMDPPPLAADADLDRIGSPTVNGVSLGLAPTSIAGKPNPMVDGSGYLVHWRGRPFKDKRLHVDVWLQPHPDQTWAVGELVITGSNSALDGWQVTLADDIRFGWSKGLTIVDGMAMGQPLMRKDDWLADGQARSYRFTLGWVGRMTPAHVHSALLDVEHAIVANGIQTPSYMGVVAETQQDQVPWVVQHWQGARSRLHGWEAGPLGGAANSGRTGAQEDQGYSKGSRAYAPGGLGVEAVRYYVALGGSRRPCNHLEPNGDRLTFDHDRLVFWDGRPHWHKGVSPDQLGLSEQPQNGWRTHQWWGPDRQHWFINTLAFATEVTGSPALQWQLEKHAVIWRYQETIDPAKNTSSPDAARSQGWAGIVAAQLWHVLEDRELALFVAERFQQRVQLVYVPFYQRARLWDRQDDARVTQYVDQDLYPWVSMVYQSAFATMGVTLGVRGYPDHVPGIKEARRLAYEQALLVLDHAYDEQLRGWEIVGVEPDGFTLADELIEGVSAHRTGWFEAAWLPGCAWTVLQTDPDNAKALAIYRRATAGDGPNDWMPPR